ncbi:MAG: fasciclin domain-containing protein [Bacteroidaceae bacterium]|nr:fasciclin domain-containing protein [Bacteroidaceae bacterium]
MNRRLFALLCAICVLWSCKEDVDESARYVFKYDTMSSYLEKHDVYSEYVEIIKRTPVSPISSSTLYQLMSARGNYTVFAPTNEAIHDYLEKLVQQELIPEPSWEAFQDSVLLDSIYKVIAYNSIIDGGDVDVYHTYDFPTQTNGEFDRGNFLDLKLTVQYTNNPDEIFICKDCPINIKNRDILTTNGVLHQMEKVIAPDDKAMSTILSEYLSGRKEGFFVMARLCEACGLMDTLSKVRDEVYEQLYLRGQITPTWPANGMASVAPGKSFTPQHRKYGFTIFAEPDAFWEAELGKNARDITPEDVQDWVEAKGYYPDATANEDYKSFDNMLNQWTTYHVLDYKLAPNRLIFHFCEYGYKYTVSTSYTIPVMEYYPTMGKRRLLKIYESPECEGIYLNRFPIIDNGRTGTGHEIGCDPDKTGNKVDRDDPDLELHTATNGYLYAIDKPLAYDQATRNNLGRQRIRMDAMSWFPEAANSDIRCQLINDDEHGWVHIPYDAEYHYFKNLNINEGSTFVYCNGYGKNWSNYCADEIKCVGRWELTFKLPPVPMRNTYEIRYRVIANGNRGVAQIYFGTDPNKMAVTGIPVDLTMGGADPQTGWEEDTDDEDYNAEVDKRMRNLGYMKGERSIDCLNSGANSRSTTMKHIIRHIIIRQTLDPDKTYYIRFKSVLDKLTPEFYMDGLEWCPKEVYDNPETPEDIW